MPGRQVYVVTRCESYSLKAHDPDEAVSLSEVYAPDTTQVFVEISAKDDHPHEDEESEDVVPH